MDIQTIFYLLASIFMILGIAVMLSLLLLIFYMKSSAEALKQKMSEHINEVFRARKFAGIIPIIGMIIKWVAERRNQEK